MRFPGYLVTTQEDGSVVIRPHTFDETELTPDSKWTEAYGSSDEKSGWWGGVKLEAALDAARRRFAGDLITHGNIDHTHDEARENDLPLSDEIPFK